MTILANSNVSRGKFAAAAVHAALNWYGIDHGAVIVLGSKGQDIESECAVIVRDAGRTEVDPGTVTAGVKSHENARGKDYIAVVFSTPFMPSSGTHVFEVSDVEKARQCASELKAEWPGKWGQRDYAEVKIITGMAQEVK
jgi:PTH2 family peptidyl-tRNA hydrolase